MFPFRASPVDLRDSFQSSLRAYASKFPLMPPQMTASIRAEVLQCLIITMNELHPRDIKTERALQIPSVTSTSSATMLARLPIPGIQYWMRCSAMHESMPFTNFFACSVRASHCNVCRSPDSGGASWFLAHAHHYGEALPDKSLARTAACSTIALVPFRGSRFRGPLSIDGLLNRKGSLARATDQEFSPALSPDTA